MADSSTLKRARTAFHFFREEHTKVLKAQGHSMELSALQPALSSAFQALSGAQKSKYTAMEAQDKERYEQEAAAANAAAAAAQAAARDSNAATDVSGPRSSRAAAAPAKAARKVTAEEDMSEEQLARRQVTKEQRAKDKAERQLKEAEVAKQHEAVDAAHKNKAQKRLRYLLAQSDIFKTHFGVGQLEEDATAAAAASAASSKGKAAAAAGGGSSSSAKANGASRRTASATPVEETVDEEEVHAITHLSKQPPSLQGQLRNYQLEGLNWMINLQEQGINGVLADEMGLGKTLQSISVLAYMADYKQVRGPHLVLLPKSTLGNWGNEFRTFCPSMRVLRLHGEKEERVKLVQEQLQPGIPQEQRSWDVCLTTYEMAKKELGALSKIGWRYLIIDEAHKLKNENSLVSSTVRNIKADHRLLLTGTPLQNNLHELWALLNILLPDVFADADQFNEFFNLDTDDADAKKTMLSQLHKILRPFMLRRLKSDAAKELPPKVETILFTGLAPLQRGLYKDILMRNMDTVNSNGTGLQKTAMMNIVMQLRKCCNHPYLFPGVEDRTLDPLGEHLIESCGKLRLLDKLLKKLKEQGHRVLIFSQMTRMLDIMEDMMHMREHEYCRIDGDTSYDQRDDLIDAFNAPNSSKFCFLLSTRAGGLGINLQTADTVILFDSDWNPQADLQAQDRAHRIGQRRPVRVFRLVTENTVEEKVVERAQQKLKLDAMVVQQGRLQEKANQVGKDQLMEALRFGADAVFRTQEGAEVTDEDVDAILARGEAKTAELNAKLQKMEKGDLLDFRLDGGMAVQTFEGTDFSDKANRQLMEPMYIDTGKRNRKPVDAQLAAAIAASIGTTSAAAAAAAAKRKIPRLPSPLGLPTMHDWQFYDKARINELQQAAVDKLTAMRESGADVPYETDVLERTLFSPQDAAERRKLLSEGYADWSSRSGIRVFVDSCALYGREATKEIAAALGKSEADVAQYTGAFFKLGPTHIDPVDWERWLSRIDKGEKRLAELNRLQRAAAVLVSKWEDPWRQLEFKHAKVLSGFTAEEDRLMLCYAVQYGWGAWDRVHEALLRTPRVRYDYYLHSLPDWAIGRRCEHLIRVAEKDLLEAAVKKRAETERKTAASGKRLAKEEAAKAEIADRASRLDEAESQVHELEAKVAEIEKQQALLNKLAAAAQSGVLHDVLVPAPAVKQQTKAAPAQQQQQHSKGPRGSGSGSVNDASKLDAVTAASNAARLLLQKMESGGGSSTANGHNGSSAAAAAAAAADSTDDEGTSQPTAKRSRLSTGPRTATGSLLPQERLPELVRLIHNSTDISHNKVALVNKFNELYPAYSKNMVASSLRTVAVYETRPETDPEQPSGLRWHVRTEYKQLLHAPQHMGMLPAELEYADRAAAYRAKRAAEGGGDAPSPTKKGSKSAAGSKSEAKSAKKGSKSDAKTDKKSSSGKTSAQSSPAKGSKTAAKQTDAKTGGKKRLSTSTSPPGSPKKKKAKTDEEAKTAPKTGGKKAAAASAAAGASPAATSAKKTRLPMSGLLMYSNAKKAAVRRALAVGGADVTPEQVTAEVRRQWQELSAEQQQPYKAKADAVVAERAEAKRRKEAEALTAETSAAAGSSSTSGSAPAAAAAAAAGAVDDDETEDEEDVPPPPKATKSIVKTASV